MNRPLENDRNATPHPLESYFTEGLLFPKRAGVHLAARPSTQADTALFPVALCLSRVRYEIIEKPSALEWPDCVIVAPWSDGHRHAPLLSRTSVLPSVLNDARLRHGYV